MNKWVNKLGKQIRQCWQNVIWGWVMQQITGRSLLGPLFLGECLWKFPFENLHRKRVVAKSVSAQVKKPLSKNFDDSLTLNSLTEKSI